MAGITSMGLYKRLAILLSAVNVTTQNLLNEKITLAKAKADLNKLLDDFQTEMNQ